MKLPILIALPHDKSFLPPEVRENIILTDDNIAEHYCDYGSKELFDHKIFHKVEAKFGRLYCDLNRASDDWSLSPDFKSAGVVREVTTTGQPIYKKFLTNEDKNTRVEEHNRFYAECLQVIENENIQFFIAGHTMETYPPTEEPSPENIRPDVVISTNNFQTCNEVHAYLLADAFRQQGFTVKIDDPFLGGNLLTHFCSTDKLPGVQIEMRRGLFSTSAHDINNNKLQDASARVMRAILEFWKNFQLQKK